MQLYSPYKKKHSIEENHPITTRKYIMERELVVEEMKNISSTTNSLTPSPQDSNNIIPKTPKSPFSTKILMSPLASPIMKKALTYIEEIGHITKLHDPDQDDWLPITESRSGNAYYAAFHTLCSGIGVQALLLPLAFITLGWIWGIISLSLVFIWQLYTLWLLIQLHEFTPGMRYSRYLRLSIAAFGEKLGTILALVPTMYLSGGTCVTLIMIGGSTMKIFFQTICASNSHITTLSTLEWYIVFTVSAIVLAQLPNLNSIAGISFIGSISAVTYCTLTWVISVIKERPQGVSFEHVENKSDVARICSILNALGMIAFAFRGHNLVLEIQGTMPSNLKNPSHVPMWKGVKFSYSIIALCLFPLAIGGYWAYGNLMPNGGILSALDKYHGEDTPKAILGITSLLVAVHCLTSFQIYAMPVFDNWEFRYTRKKKKSCPWWLRTGLRVFFGCLTFFISVALPFLPSLAGLIGGIALPVTLAYPCLMWIMIKKPKRYSPNWFVNWSLGLLGLVLSVLLVFGAIWTIATQGMDVHFFKTQ